MVEFGRKVRTSHQQRILQSWGYDPSTSFNMIPKNLKRKLVKAGRTSDFAMEQAFTGEALSPKQKAVLLLLHKSHKSYEVIASRLNLTSKGVRRVARSALLILNQTASQIELDLVIDHDITAAACGACC